MADLDDRMRSLDRVDVPDLWARVESWEPSAGDAGPGRRRGRAVRKVVLAVATLAVAGVAIGFAAVSFRGAGVGATPTSTHAVTPTSSSSASMGPPVRTSVVVRHGQLRCTARFPSTRIAPGDPTHVGFSVTNVGSTPQSIPVGVNGTNGSLVIRNADGRLLANSIHMHDGIFGPIPQSKLVQPGGTLRIGAWDPNLLWPGSLAVTPACFDRRMPSVQLVVSAPGAAPDANQAISEVVDAVGAPFERCRPTVDGVPVYGTVSAHEDFSARCQAAVRQFQEFDEVVVGIISPPHAEDIDLLAIADELGVTPGTDESGPATLSYWRYVVTGSHVEQVGRHRAIGWRCNGYSYSAGGGIAPCHPNA